MMHIHLTSFSKCHCLHIKMNKWNSLGETNFSFLNLGLRAVTRITVFSAVSEESLLPFPSLLQLLYSSELESPWRCSKAALWVDFNSPFSSEGTADIVMYFCPLINTVAHSKGFWAVESSPSRLYWSGLRSRYLLPHRVTELSDSVAVTGHLCSSHRLMMMILNKVVLRHGHMLLLFLLASCWLAHFS